MGRTDSIALARLAELFFKFLTVENGVESELAGETMRRDWQRSGRRDPPEFLRLMGKPTPVSLGVRHSRGPARQARHLGAE